MLLGHYRSLHRRNWAWAPAGEEPHFFDHRHGAALLLAREGNPYGWFRAFYAAELLRPDDRVLDIGAGDGFFDRTFFAERCAWVDAIDIEPSAIEHATSHNAAPNIAYHLLDAVNEGFPNPPYDVIVWDGAIGHFAAADTDTLLEKIRDALSPHGICAGSESLGREGHDHLQFFESLDDIRALLERHFDAVELRRMEYVTPGGELRRTEAYWRCAQDRRRLDEVAWNRSR